MTTKAVSVISPVSAVRALKVTGLVLAVAIPLITALGFAASASWTASGNQQKLTDSDNHQMSILERHETRITSIEVKQAEAETHTAAAIAQLAEKMDSFKQQVETLSANVDKRMDRIENKLDKKP